LLDTGANHRMGGMGEENPNFEARNSKQILNSNIPMFKTSNWFSLIAFVKVCFDHLTLRFWLLFRISDLEFRIYPLLSQKNPVPHPLCPSGPFMGKDQHIKEAFRHRTYVFIKKGDRHE
jgi:hypothetical protein